MKPKLTARHGVLASLLVASVASAQTKDRSLIIEPADDGHPRNHIGLNYRMGLNMTAGFKNLGGFKARTNPGPATGGGVDRFYDDGYNRVDISRNAGGQTWFWGYQNASQIQGTPSSGTVVMHSSASSSGASSEGLDGDPQHGLELTYNRELGHAGKFRWGVEGGLGFANVTIRDSRVLSGAVTRTSDSFSRNIIAPTPPYSGNFTGPGPVIGDSPSRSQTIISSGPGSATISGQRTLDVNVLSLRLGPYLEIPLTKRLAFSLSGGLALAEVNSDFKFQESASIAGLGTESTVGGGSHSDLLAGGYLAGNLSWALNRSVNLLAGAQYMNVGNYSHVLGGKKAEINFGNSILVTFGLGYSF
jgi:hypothetical protein